MGKRKKERSNSKIRRKIKCLERKLRDLSTSQDEEGCNYQENNVEMLTGQRGLPDIINCMRAATSHHHQTSHHDLLAATQDLLESLESAKAYFDKENERNLIIDVICEATRSSDNGISVAALQCLVKILSLYYQYMESYMDQTLLPITLEAMKSEVYEISLQGIEFWSNVSNTEIAIDDTMVIDTGRPPAHVSRFYARGALPYLAPVLIQKLTKQDGTKEAAFVCLMLLSNCCGDKVVPHVLPFIKSNIKNLWYREAAWMAFGSMCGGQEANTLKPFVDNDMPTLIEALYDFSGTVRLSATWILRRIFKIVSEADIIINESYLKPLLDGLVNGLKAEPRVAANVCWTFKGLAEAAYKAADCGDSNQPKTYCMSKYFDFIVQRLLETTDRQDAAQHNLRLAAFVALMEMVRNSPTDCYVTVRKTTMVIFKRLQQVLEMENHMSCQADRSQLLDLRSLLCATLQSILCMATQEDALQISDAIMIALLPMFAGNEGRAEDVQEDVLMVVSTLVGVLGEGFLKYMDAFKKYLYVGLKNHQEYPVRIAAVGLTGDICRALKSKVLPYCDEIIQSLVENPGDLFIHRSVKSWILSVFNDIVCSIGLDFAKYFEVVKQFLLTVKSDVALVESHVPAIVTSIVCHCRSRDRCWTCCRRLVDPARHSPRPLPTEPPRPPRSSIIRFETIHFHYDGTEFMIHFNTITTATVPTAGTGSSQEERSSNNVH